MVAFNPNWAAIAQILGGALAAPDGQYAQGAAQGAQNYQQFANARQDQQYRQQQMDLQRQEFDFQKQQADAAARAEEDWRNQFSMSQPQVAQVGPPRPDQPRGYQTATQQQPSPFGDLTPTQRALLMAADKKTGLGLLAQWMEPQEAEGPQSGLGKLAADLKAGRISRAEYDAAVRKENYIAPQQPQQAPATNLITLVGPKGEVRSFDSRDPQIAGLVAKGWVERDRSLFPAPPAGYQPRADGQPGVEPLPGGPADPNRPTEAQRNDFKKQTLALDNLEAALSDYEAALDKFGSLEAYGEGKGILENAYANVLIQAKEAANLGALTGPDMSIMNQTVIGPNTAGQAFVGGAPGVKSQIGNFRAQLKTKRSNLNTLYGGQTAGATPPPPPGFEPLQ